MVTHASYRGLSYKSALDGWFLCVRHVRLSRLLGNCGIRKQYYRSYCCSLFFNHSATLVKWLGHVTLRYATSEHRHQHPDQVYELHDALVPIMV